MLLDLLDSISLPQKRSLDFSVLSPRHIKINNTGNYLALAFTHVDIGFAQAKDPGPKARLVSSS